MSQQNYDNPETAEQEVKRLLNAIYDASVLLKESQEGIAAQILEKAVKASGIVYDGIRFNTGHHRCGDEINFPSLNLEGKIVGYSAYRDWYLVQTPRESFKMVTGRVLQMMEHGVS